MLIFCFVFSSVQQLDKFANLRVLILDHNNISSLRSFPSCKNLETLSLAYNTVRDLNETLMIISQNYPSLRHLNLIKNPINPMFAGQSDKYDQFRAKFKIWLPALTTLDGIDFAKDMGKIDEMRGEVEREKTRAL